MERRFLWMIGLTMWEGWSPANWTMNSPKSVSRASMPFRSRNSASSISSLTMVLALTIFVPPRAFMIPCTIPQADSAVAAQCTCAPCSRSLASAWVR